MKEYLYKSVPGNFKDVDSSSMKVAGVFSKFNVLDSDGDVVLLGSTTKSISERGPKSSHPRIKHFLNHDTRLTVGVLDELYEREQEQDLYYESNIGKHQLGKDFILQVESGIITEHSIGFKPIKYSNTDTGYNFSEIKLWEGSSLTAWGANEFTPMFGRKCFDKENLSKLLDERQRDIEKFIRNSTASDETLELLSIEIKQLQQLVFDVLNSETQMPPKAHLPLEKEKEEAALAMLKLIKYKI